MKRAVTMSSVQEATTWETEHLRVNVTDAEGGPSEWAAGVGSAVMLAFFVEGVVGTCWMMVMMMMMMMMMI